MANHESGQTTNYNQLLLMRQITDDLDFQRASAVLQNMQRDVDLDEERYTAVTGLLADVSERYGASPEVMAAALDLWHAPADV